MHRRLLFCGDVYIMQALISRLSAKPSTGPWMKGVTLPYGICYSERTHIMQALISRRAPKMSRGALGGLMTVTGSCGILFVGKVGGLAYDGWGPGAALQVGALLIPTLFTLYTLRPSP
jgi:predicted MFS family arabinose efflux permease